jgi:beta-phosphoglucomutase-like phosphatase (HAD superfamily)
VLSGARPRQGAECLLEELVGRVPLGIASNSPRALVEAALRGAGFAGAFDAVVGEDEVRRPKPAAEPYLLACSRLGAEPRRSVALEDSPVGVAAARAAGMFVIGVPSVASTKLEADLVVSSLTEPAVPMKIRSVTGSACRIDEQREISISLR